jgi:hypothetical protein
MRWLVWLFPALAACGVWINNPLKQRAARELPERPYLANGVSLVDRDTSTFPGFDTYLFCRPHRYGPKRVFSGTCIVYTCPHGDTEPMHCR